MTSHPHVPGIIAALTARGETVSVAESVTAGGLGRALTFSPGASAVFLGGVIAYTNKVKTEHLDIDPHLISRHSVVSEEVANAMAELIRNMLTSDAITMPISPIIKKDPIEVKSFVVVYP